MFQFDAAFEEVMERADLTVNGKTFDASVGYYGSEIVAVYAFTPATTKRRKVIQNKNFKNLNKPTKNY